VAHNALWVMHRAPLAALQAGQLVLQRLSRPIAH
jgi:hypothetical protein